MNTEAIAAVLGGTPRAVAAAARILAGLSEYELPRASQEQLRKVARISSRQAAILHNALALAAHLAAPLKRGQRFCNSQEIFARYAPRFYSVDREHFLALLLDSKNALIRECLIAVGSLSSSVVHPREAFRPAVQDGAAAVIFLHNHPSGDSSPSLEDRECTKRLARAGRVLGIRVLDHIVIGHQDYFSFADAGELNVVE
jgi:DNA repair protein RadC